MECSSVSVKGTLQCRNVSILPLKFPLLSLKVHVGVTRYFHLNYHTSTDVFIRLLSLSWH